MIKGIPFIKAILMLLYPLTKQKQVKNIYLQYTPIGVTMNSPKKTVVKEIVIIA